MTNDEYLELMQFPAEWKEWNLVPDDEFIRTHILSLRPGEEHAPEHYRHEAFHYWLSRMPAADILEKLANLTFVDPDAEMAESIRAEILKQPNCNDDLRELILESQ